MTLVFQVANFLELDGPGSHWLTRTRAEHYHDDIVSSCSSIESTVTSAIVRLRWTQLTAAGRRTALTAPLKLTGLQLSMTSLSWYAGQTRGTSASEGASGHRSLGSRIDDHERLGRTVHI